MNRSLKIAAMMLWTCVALLGANAAYTQQRPSGLPAGYPSKPVRVVITSTPGGSLDISGRAVSTKLGERWGGTFVLENRGGGNTGFDLVSRAAPDGYTLMVSSNTLFFAADQVVKVPYDVRTKFPPIAQFLVAPYVLSVNNELPVATMKELIAYAKENPNRLNYAYVSGGSASQLVGELLKILAAVNIEGIPYKGVGPAYIEQMAGRVHITIGTAASAMPLVKGGKIKAIAVTTTKRSKAIPNLPSITETIPNFDNFDSFAGLFGVEGMAPGIIAAYNREVNVILALPDVEKLLNADGSETSPGSPELLRQSVASSLDSARRVVKQANLKLEE